MRYLFAFLAVLFAMPAAAEVTLLDSYVWQSDDPSFGGFSGIEVTDDGIGFLAVSDRGRLALGRIIREGDTIVDVTLDEFSLILGPDGTLLTPAESDSEGLALTPDAGFFVSYEWSHGLRYFDAFGANAGPLLTAPQFADLQPNSSFEAVAIDADGVLYTMPERSGVATRPFPVHRLKDGVWDQPFDIPRIGPYLISGADIGPDGMLYLLERDFVGIGFRSRVRRFSLDGSGGETLLETGVRTHDNLEGISVWEDAAGLRMTLISDDNFRVFQRTEIVEYRLTQ